MERGQLLTVLSGFRDSLMHQGRPLWIVCIEIENGERGKVKISNRGKKQPMPKISLNGNLRSQLNLWVRLFERCPRFHSRRLGRLCPFCRLVLAIHSPLLLLHPFCSMSYDVNSENLTIINLFFYEHPVYSIKTTAY